MKLHLGCGPRHIPGFYHVDVVPFPHADLVSSVDRLPLIQDGAAELIYACHVLEHFPRRQTAEVLQEWHRLLRPGGLLRVAVPDFEALARLYLRIAEGGSPDGPELALSRVIGPLFGRQDYLYNLHHTVFDFPALRQVLHEAGFTDVHRYDWRQTEHAEVDDYSQSYYPHLDKEQGMLLSLNVEAIRS